MTKIQVQALTQTNIVSKKELYYLVIGEGDEAYAINVGKATYDRVYKLLTGTNTPEEMGLKVGGKK